MTQATTSRRTDAVFSCSRYLIRTQVFKLFGGAYHIYDEHEQLIGYSRMKAFKLKEDIRLYSDESMSEELLTINARSVIDFSSGYDVTDARTGERVGTLKRRGFKSLIRDEWVILDSSEREIGKIEEDSTLKALLRRFVEIVSLLMPQQYRVEMAGQSVVRFSQRINPFIFKLDVDLREDASGLFDARLAVAAGLLLAAIEGRQSSE